MNVEFYPFDAKSRRFADSGQGVFRCVSGRAAMADHGGKSCRIAQYPYPSRRRQACVRCSKPRVKPACRTRIPAEVRTIIMPIAAAGALLTQGGAVGRKLDFLAQELNREANTLCAKSNDAQLSDIGLELKAVIDQFREQVQNIELSRR